MQISFFVVVKGTLELSQQFNLNQSINVSISHNLQHPQLGPTSSLPLGPDTAPLTVEVKNVL